MAAHFLLTLFLLANLGSSQTVWRDVRVFSGLTSDCSSTTPFEETFTQTSSLLCSNVSCSATGGAYNSAVCVSTVSPLISSPRIIVTTFPDAQCQGMPTSVQYVGATPFTCLGAAGVSYWYECNSTTGVTRLRYQGTSGACFSASPDQVLTLSSGPLGVCSGFKIATCVGFANGTATTTTKAATTTTSGGTTRPASASLTCSSIMFAFSIVLMALLN